MHTFLDSNYRFVFFDVDYYTLIVDKVFYGSSKITLK